MNSRWIRCLAAGISVAVLLAGCDALTSDETRLERAENHLAQGNYRHAVIELSKLLQGDDANARARVLLAQAEIGLGDLLAAQASLQQAVATGATIAEVSSLHSQVQLGQGRFEELLTQIEVGEVTLAEPERSIILGRANLGLRRLEVARQAYESALQLQPGSIDAQVGMAEVLAVSGDVQGALDRLGEIATSHPAAALAWHLRGSLLLQLGRYEEGEKALGVALANAKGQLSETQQMQALSGQVEARLAAGDIARADEGLQELIRRAPGAALTRFLQARLDIARQDMPGAIQKLTALTSDLPDFHLGRFLLGSALLAQGNLYQAEQQLAAVVRANPGNLEATKRLAEVRLRMNRPEAALALLGPALDGTANDPQAEALLGAAQLGAGADPTAITKLEQSVARDPDNRNARLDLATLYIGRGDANRAVALLQDMPHSKGDSRREFLLIRAISESRGAIEARAEVDRLVRDQPQDIELLNLAAGYYLTAGDAPAAVAVLDRALAMEPGHLPSLLATGRARLASGELDMAEAVYRRALSRDEANVDARIGLAEVYGRRGKPEESRRWLEEVRSGDAKAVASRLLLARLYLAGKESAKASKVVNEALAAAPGRADVLIAAGSLYQDVGQHEIALGYFRKAADLEPQQASHWLAMARAQSTLGFRPAARESLGRALRLEPNSVPGVGLAVLLDLSDGSQEAALARILALRSQLPADANAAMIEGDVRSAMGQHVEAERAYAEAGKLRGSLQATVRQTQARQRAGLRDSTAPIRGWLQRYPGDTQARAMHGLFLQQAGMESQAIAEYEQVVSSGRRDPVTANNLAGLYHSKGDPRAENLARSAFQDAPTSGAIADTLGWILVSKGAHDEGIQILRKAAALAPKEIEIRLNLAEGLLMAGKRDEARSTLQEILAKDADFPGRARAEQLMVRAKGSAR